MTLDDVDAHRTYRTDADVYASIEHQRRLGFVPTGEMLDDEVELVLDLSP